MHLKKHSLSIEKYDFENRNVLTSLLSKHQYFQDLDGFSFDLFPTANVFLLRGSTWIYKDLIIGFCLIIDCKNLTAAVKCDYAQACEIDYKNISFFDGIILQEIGVIPPLRYKGLGNKLFDYVKSEFPNSLIILRALESAIGFWEKMGFSFISGTQNNNMTLENKTNLSMKANNCNLTASVFEGQNIRNTWKW